MTTEALKQAIHQLMDSVQSGIMLVDLHETVRVVPLYSTRSVVVRSMA